MLSILVKTCLARRSVDENIRKSQSVTTAESTSRKSGILNKAKTKLNHHRKSSSSTVAAPAEPSVVHSTEAAGPNKRKSLLKSIIHRREEDTTKSSLSTSVSKHQIPIATVNTKSYIRHNLKRPESPADLKTPINSDIESPPITASAGVAFRDKLPRSPVRMQSTPLLQPAISALKNFEAQIGPEISRQLTFDYSSKLKDPVRKPTLTALKFNPERDSIDSANTTANEDLSSSVSDTSIASAGHQDSPKPNSKLNKPAHELDAERRRKADEYYNIELKQANLLKLLMSSVYLKFKAENERLQYALCDKESMDSIFNIIITLASFADLVHGEVAAQIRQRLESEWLEKPYFGDILVAKSHYYKTYKPVLQRFSECQLSLSNMLKKKSFASYLKGLLEKESIGLEKVNRIDILFDRLVDFPRRIIQLLESYLKCLEPSSQEHRDIAACLDMFTKIFERSNDELNKTSNFQACLSLQQVLLESSNFKENIANAEHPLIKQGPIYKVID